MTEEKKGVGRPTKYKPEYARIAAKLCDLGATDADLAEALDVNEDTINEWKKVHSDFSESLKEAKSKLDQKVEKSLYQRARGYKHQAVKIFNHEGSPMEVEYTEHYPPDTTACIFWLKNRQPGKWRDKQEHELSGKEGAPPIAVINVGTKPKNQ